MSVFMPTSISPTAEEPDPRKHVNYVLGMVLGVDDFTQEFAYLAERDQLALRELLGAGTVRGLRIAIEVDAQKGPEVVVSAGLAVTPAGKIVRVPLTQCAFLNEWITRHKVELTQRGVNPPIPPDPPAIARLYVVLSYQERTTDLVPIPGEPCRTEQESMAASRVTDDFQLELRLDAPEQREQDARRQYLEWLGSVPIVETGAPLLRDFLEAIATAAARAPKAVSPQPGSSPAPLPAGAAIFDVVPDVSIPRGSAALYYREAIRLFSTLRAEWLGAGQGADGTAPNEEALLLAELEVPISLDELTSDLWQVSSTTPVAINEGSRQAILPASFVQEVLFAVAERGSRASVTHPLAPAGFRYLLAAAGLCNVKDNEDDAPAPTDPVAYNGLTAWASADDEISVKFNGPTGPGVQYVVKVLPVASTTKPDLHVTFGAFLASGPLVPGDAPRFNLRVTTLAGGTVLRDDLRGRQLMIEVSAFGAA